MSRLGEVTRPVPYLDEPALRRICLDRQPLVGAILSHGGRRYRVTGWDPVSVRPGRVYLDELETGNRYALVIRDGS